MKKRGSSFFKFLIWLAIVSTVVTIIARVYYRTTDDIRLANMTHDLPVNPLWDTVPLSPEGYAQLAQILDQKFYYIGKGAQSYAFKSEDDEYVIKFFKFKHLKPSVILQLLPPIGPLKSYRMEQELRKRRKIEGVFEGYKLAFDEHREDSGLIYVHLNPTNTLHRQVTIVDKIGFERKIDLDPIVFLVQRKGKTLRSTISDYLDAGKVDEAKQAINKIFSMYLSEYAKGVYDRDHGVMHNTGFVNDKPFHLDVGKLTKNDAMRQSDVRNKDLRFISWKIDQWIKSNYPQQYPLLSDYIAEEYLRSTGEILQIKDLKLSDFKQSKRKKLI